MTAAITVDRLAESKTRAVEQTLTAADRASQPVPDVDWTGTIPELRFADYHDVRQWTDYGLVGVSVEGRDTWVESGRATTIGHLRVSSLPWCVLISWPLNPPADTGTWEARDVNSLPRRTPGAALVAEPVVTVIEGQQFTEPESGVGILDIRAYFSGYLWDRLNVDQRQRLTLRCREAGHDTAAWNAIHREISAECRTDLPVYTEGGTR